MQLPGQTITWQATTGPDNTWHAGTWLGYIATGGSYSNRQLSGWPILWKAAIFMTGSQRLEKQTLSWQAATIGSGRHPQRGSCSYYRERQLQRLDYVMIGIYTDISITGNSNKGGNTIRFQMKESNCSLYFYILFVGLFCSLDTTYEWGRMVPSFSSWLISLGTVHSRWSILLEGVGFL